MPRSAVAEHIFPVEAESAVKRVLIVEDNLDAAETLGDLLEFWGYHAQAVHNGPDGILAAAGFRPHIVLLDIGLPGMDGYAVARTFREAAGDAASDGAPRPVLVALTGYGQDEDRRLAREAGFDHHLTKPVDPDALRALLGQV